jgi:GxxExxY protein
MGEESSRLSSNSLGEESSRLSLVLRQIADDIWASLGPGYSESVYHCAFEVALRGRHVYYETERIVPVFYEGQNVGNVRADLIIDRRAVVELKSVARLNEQYRIQTRNYMTLLGLNTGYLINFPDKNVPLEFETFSVGGGGT